MNRQNWDHDKLEGTDADLETSLREYGFAWIEGKEEFLVYYGITYTDDDGYFRFDFCTIEKDRDIFKEHDWVDWEELNKTIGMDIKDCSLMQQYTELLGIYGYENIFGSTYWEGLTYYEVMGTVTKKVEVEEWVCVKKTVEVEVNRDEEEHLIEAMAREEAYKELPNYETSGWELIASKGCTFKIEEN